jgi:hypothetical protein
LIGLDSLLSNCVLINWANRVVWLEQRVLGPFPAGNTATYLGVFRLIGILRRMKEWGGTLYWEYLKGLILERKGVEGVS